MELPPLQCLALVKSPKNARGAAHLDPTPPTARLGGLKLASRHESFRPGAGKHPNRPDDASRKAEEGRGPARRNARWYDRPSGAAPLRQRSQPPPARTPRSAQGRRRADSHRGPGARPGHAVPRAPQAAGTASRGRAPPPPTPRRAAQHEDLRARHRPSKGRARSRPGAAVCPSPSPALRPGLRLTPRGTAVPAEDSGKGHGMPRADQQVPKKTAGAFWL